MFKSIKEWYTNLKNKRKKKVVQAQTAQPSSNHYTKNDATTDATIILLDAATSAPYNTNKEVSLNGGNFSGGGAGGTWDPDKIHMPKPEPVPVPTPAVVPVSVPESSNLYSSSSYTSSIQGTTPSTNDSSLYTSSIQGTSSNDSSFFESVSDVASSIASSIGDSL